MSKVYIILVNYNGWEDTVECMESLFKLEYDNFEIVLVDNASPNSSVSKIISWSKGEILVFPKSDKLANLSQPAKQKPLIINQIKSSEETTLSSTPFDFTLIEALENKGFSSGNNIGIKYALRQKDADFFWILNNYTVVLPNSLALLVKRYRQDHNIGILGEKVKYYFEPEMLQCAGGATYNKWLAYSKQVGNQEVDKGQFDNSDVKLDLIIGACMLVDFNFITNIGLLSEEYFLYYEEQDWAERSKLNGLELGYEHNAVIYHKEGQSIVASQLDLRGISKLSDFYYARNKIILTKKYFSYLCRITVYLSFILIAINRIRRGQSDRIRMLLGILKNPNKGFEN